MGARTDMNIPTHAEVFAAVDKTLHPAGEREHAAIAATYDYMVREMSDKCFLCGTQLGSYCPNWQCAAGADNAPRNE
jgi:hypothetical protein